ncbi:hypothetical protein [Acetivibrio ethanolgignens]|uniref:SAF domain-containing protein n=1 Tax=Acetivibrio ethanolgignens TaxID=290052 RepID=A0A0V8QF00_9FIRM|nr:hypothetical protein [Acetivibrio ethanolgignens]KSV59167.1 hypothetical protein ASU35_10445 [Acetivibrio ethanolgignens]
MNKFKQKGAVKHMTAEQLKIVIAVMSVLLVIVVVGFFWYVRKAASSAQVDVGILNSQIRAATRLIYKTNIDVKQGDCLTKEMVEGVSDLVNVDPSLLLSEADFGKIAAVDIPKGSIVMANMVSMDIAANYRERECSFIWLSSNLLNNDFVDIRILFPNGEDFVVIPKKSIKSPDIANNNVFLWLTEDEIERLDSAVVDANLHSAKLYTTRYVRPAIQSASTVTYQPNSSVMALMSSNPDVVDQAKRSLSAEARRGLETRIAQFKQANPDFVLEDTLEVLEQRRLEAGAYTDDTSANAGASADNPNMEANQLDTVGDADATGEDTGEDGVVYVD